MFIAQKIWTHFLRRLPTYYNNDKEMPIFGKTIHKDKKRLYSVEDIVRLLLNPKLKSSRFVANKVPATVSSSMSFVIKLDNLDAKEDTLCSDMGVWRNNRTDKIELDVIFQNSATV